MIELGIAMSALSLIFAGGILALLTWMGLRPPRPKNHAPPKTGTHAHIAREIDEMWEQYHRRNG